MIPSGADITVLICTCNRLESLRETLNCLAQTDRASLRCEVVVVDNAEVPLPSDALDQFRCHFPLDVRHEPRPGKPFALNRALAEAPLGSIVAVLDDDMSPHREWFRGIADICARWPDRYFFTGRSYVIWPPGPVPDWCRRPSLQGWAYSVMDYGPEDRPLGEGRWYSGNHFWFRSSVLADGRRFSTELADSKRHVDISQARFMLQLAEEGYGGVYGPDAVCGHRVQPGLLRESAIRRRAMLVGRGFAHTRLIPYKRTVKQARLLHRHPILGRAYCATALVGWGASFFWSFLALNRVRRLEKRFHSIERWSTYKELLHIANRSKEYRILKRTAIA